MSKSAIKALTAAQEIIAKAGVTVNLVGYIADKDVRKNWRNADALAALIINSAANAFQCENSETLVENQAWFNTMTDAVTAYTDSNLDSWNGKTWAQKDTDIELVRLEGMVNANMNFEAGVAAAAAKKLVKSASAAQLLSEATGFPVEMCEAELAAEEGDYFAALTRLRSIVEVAHEEALVIDNAMDEAYPLARQVLLWSFMDEESRRAMLDANHTDALKQDEKYQEAIACLSDNLIQPLWEGASDTVKAAITKHQRTQAEEGTGTIPASDDGSVVVRQYASQAGTLQMFWSTLNEYQKEFLLGVAYDQALEIDAELASLGQFRLPLPTQEEIEARYFRSLTDTELAYALEPGVAPEYRRHLYVAEAERRELQGAKVGALNELVSGASLEQAQARFVSRLTLKQLAEALFDPEFPADRRAAYAAEMQRRKGDRVSFDDTVLDAVITNLANDLLVEALNSPETPADQRHLYAQELQRRLSQTERVDRGLGFLE